MYVYVGRLQSEQSVLFRWCVSSVKEKECVCLTISERQIRNSDSGKTDKHCSLNKSK